MPHPSKILFVTAVTADYVPKAKQLFASAHEAGYWQGQYMLLAYGISLEDRHWFQSRGILVKEYDYILRNEEWDSLLCNTFHRVSIERYHLFLEEFKQWDVIVYMDADIIVMGPIIHLAQIKGFGATLDRRRFLRSNAPRGHGHDMLVQSGYDLSAPIFSSGMFAFSTDIITSNTYKLILELNQRFLPISLYADQLILNLFFYKQWHRLSMSYAYLVTLLVSVPFCSARRAIALHFAARNRPWNPKSPYHSLWQNNLQQAEQIDFTRPRPINKRVRIRARWKEMLFIPWFVYLSSAFIDRYETKRWYPLVKKLIESPTL